MAGLDVSHDDMIDLLIGHANIPMAPNTQRTHVSSPHHNQHPPPPPAHHEPHSNHGNQATGQMGHAHPVQQTYHQHALNSQYSHHHHHHQPQQQQQNQVGPLRMNVQNRVNLHHHSVQNLVNTPLSSQQQNQETAPSPQSYVAPPQDQGAVSAQQTHVITSTQSQVTNSAPDPTPPTHNQFDSPSEIPPSAESHLSPQVTHLPEQSSPNTEQTQQSPETLDQLVPNDDDDIQQFSTDDVKPQNLPHNQYLCPGCQKSILYTNRSSLVQLLGLHQEKCPGTTRYRYMCLECHSAFRTVSQLQDHEDICGPGSEGATNRSVIESDKQDGGVNGTGSEGTGGVIQSISGQKTSSEDVLEMGDEEDVKPPIGLDGLLDHQSNGMSKDGECDETKVSVRESWTQTYDQPKPERKEIVNVLLDEISPAGRKRRMCTRKLKVYNEKEAMAHIKECCEEVFKPVKKKSPKPVVKTELPVTKKGKIKGKRGRKPKKKLLMEPNAASTEQDASEKPAGETPEGEEKKPEGEKKERKKKVKKEKEQTLEVPMHCQLCPKTFTKYSMYTKHYQLNHEKAMCQYCGAQCIRKKLKQHERLHLKVFKCPYPGCEKTVNSKHRLNRHSRVHTGEKPYTCDICHKPFAGKENMVKHVKRVHEKEKKYQCRFCGQKFADRGGLKYHENTHTKQRPTDYRCKFCGRGYKSHVGCYLHERTHTGNMYKCGFCGKEFMAKVHLRKHEYIHTGNYPFRCMGCQKGFPNNGAMKKHKCIAQL